VKILRCRQWAFGLGAMGAGIGLMVFNLGVMPDELILPGRVVFFGAGAALGWFLVGRVALAGVQVQDSGILVRNPFVHRFITWGEIEAFSLGRYRLLSRLGIASLRDGSRVPLFGIQAIESAFNPGDRQAHEIVDRLNAALATSTA
jgi:Bacterial PH domain